MRFSRHAKNRMRRDRISHLVVESIVTGPDNTGIDVSGNLVAMGLDAEGRLIEIVTALDDPGYVITVIARRKSR
jgi:hypothetical protein